jgi:hypothetical protein
VAPAVHWIYIWMIVVDRRMLLHNFLAAPGACARPTTGR